MAELIDSMINQIGEESHDALAPHDRDLIYDTINQVYDIAMEQIMEQVKEEGDRDNTNGIYINNRFLENICFKFHCQINNACFVIGFSSAGIIGDGILEKKYDATIDYDVTLFKPLIRCTIPNTHLFHYELVSDIIFPDWDTFVQVANYFASPTAKSAVEN